MNKTVVSFKPKAGLLFTWESDELHWMVVTPEFYHKVKDLLDSVPSNEWVRETEGIMTEKILAMFYDDNEEYVSGILESEFTQTFCQPDIKWLNKYDFIGMTSYPSY